MPIVGQSSQIFSATQMGVGVVTSTGILDGTIANIDVAANAAIAYTKLALTGSIVLADLNASIGITEAYITLADNTTNDVSITKHGFVPKAPNLTTQYLRGDGTWQNVAASKKITHDMTVYTQSIVDTAEYTLFSVAIPAGTLGTAQGVRIKIFGQIHNQNGTVTNTVRLKYGATSIATFALTEINESAYYDFFMEVYIAANGTTSSQKAITLLHGVKDLLGGAAGNVYSGLATGTAAEDSTQAKNFLLTTQYSSTSNAQVLSVSGIIVEALNS